LLKRNICNAKRNKYNNKRYIHNRRIMYLRPQGYKVKCRISWRVSPLPPGFDNWKYISFLHQTHFMYLRPQGYKVECRISLNLRPQRYKVESRLSRRVSPLPPGFDNWKYHSFLQQSKFITISDSQNLAGGGKPARIVDICINL